MAIDGVRDGTAHAVEGCVKGVSGVLGHMYVSQPLRSWISAGVYLAFPGFLSDLASLNFVDFIEQVWRRSRARM